MTEIQKSLRYESIIADNGVVLKQLELAEAPKLFSRVEESRPYLRKWLPWVDASLTVEDTRKFIGSTLESRAQGSAYEYGIVYKGEVVGHISLMHLTDGKTPEIGYWVAESTAGKGIATSAARALTSFATETLGIDKVILCIEPDNIGSTRVAERSGYTLAGQRHDERIGRVVNIWEYESHGE